VFHVRALIISIDNLRSREDMEPRHRLQSYYGYSFESYCTSKVLVRATAPQKPGDPVGWGGDVDTNVQWCSVVRTKLGNTRLVIGGEVDCVRGMRFRQT
jgi:RAT1-interacting protein